MIGRSCFVYSIIEAFWRQICLSFALLKLSSLFMILNTLCFPTRFETNWLHKEVLFHYPLKFSCFFLIGRTQENEHLREINFVEETISVWKNLLIEEQLQTIVREYSSGFITGYSFLYRSYKRVLPSWLSIWVELLLWSYRLTPNLKLLQEKTLILLQNPNLLNSIGIPPLLISSMSPYDWSTRFVCLSTC